MADFNIYLTNNSNCTKKEMACATRTVGFVFDTSGNSLGFNEEGFPVDSQKKVVENVVNFKIWRVRYSKKVYEHNTVDVELSVTIDDTRQITQSVIVSVAGSFKDKTLSIFEDSDETAATPSWKSIATDYRIYGVTPYIDPDHSDMVMVKLKVVSPDVSLDLTRYCCTYNKALFDDKDTAKGIVNAAIELLCPSSVPLQYQNLNFSYGSKKMPYLVQYNETFYDFLVRNVNRLNDYVYYESGKLCIGHQTDNSAKDVSDLKAFVQSPVTLSSLVNSVTVDYTTNDYCSSANSALLPSDDSVNRKYNSETIDASQFYELKDDDQYKADKHIIPSGSMAVSALGYACASESIADLVVGTSGNAIKMAMLRSKIDSDLNSDWDKAKSTVTGELPDSGFTNSLFASIETNQFNNNDNYKEINYFDKSCTLLLGDVVKENVGSETTPDNKYYVVTEVTGDWFITEKTIPEQSGKGYSVDLSYHNKCCVKAHTSTCATYLGEKRIRRSNSQKAVVVQVNDPLRMGRVRVRYPWDNSKDAKTPWIRVCVPSAADDGGFLMTPSVNDEVIVNYEGGNIERPYVVGFVHTRKQRPSSGTKGYNNNAGFYKLYNKDSDNNYSDNDPMDFCISNRSGQTITMSNGKNPRSFASGMLPGVFTDIMVAKEAFKDGDKMLGGSITLTDRYGVCTIKEDTGARCVTIDSALGQVKISAFDGISINAPNGDVKIKAKNITLDAANNLTLKSGSNREMLRNAAGKNGVNLGKAATKVAMDLANAAAMYGGGYVVKGILDISYLRNVIELFLRPIDGTLSIQSSSYITLAPNGQSIKAYAANSNIEEYKKYRKARFSGIWDPIQNTNDEDSIKRFFLGEKDGEKKTPGGFIGAVFDELQEETGISSWQDLIFGTFAEWVNNSCDDVGCIKYSTGADDTAHELTHSSASSNNTGSQLLNDQNE